MKGAAARLAVSSKAEALTESVIREAAVPGSSFYSRPELGATRLRFSFCKRPETLREAGARLAAWAGSGSPPGRRRP
jgi:aspartate/methionine/tyrosine aminotransferase